jgi:hypothetical protein
MAKYSKKAGKYAKRAVKKMKKGELRSGGSGKKVKRRDQAVAHRAIGSAGKGFESTQKEEKEIHKGQEQERITMLN